MVCIPCSKDFIIVFQAPFSPSSISSIVLIKLADHDFSSAASIAALRRANFLAETRKVGGSS
jgi:hypothetical protein